LPRADAEALRILRDAGITQPPVDVDRLAKTLGATIHLDHLDPEVSGLLYRRPKNTVDHVVRARINARDHRSSLATDREEIEANRFAAALLMPPDFVEAQVLRVMKRGLGEIATIDALARKFGVSPQAMEIRLTNLGMRAVN
jgi:hypothetical protein